MKSKHEDFEEDLGDLMESCFSLLSTLVKKHFFLNIEEV